MSRQAEQNPAADLGAMDAVDRTVTQNEVDQLDDVVTAPGYRLVLSDINKTEVDKLADFVAETKPGELVLQRCWTGNSMLLRRFLRAVGSACNIKLCAHTRRSADAPAPLLNPVWLKPVDGLTALTINEYRLSHCDLTALSSLKTVFLDSIGNSRELKLPESLRDFTLKHGFYNRIVFAPGTQLSCLSLWCVHVGTVVNVPSTTQLFSVEDSIVVEFEPQLQEDTFLGGVEVNHTWIERVLPLCSKAAEFTTDVGSGGLDLRRLVPSTLPRLTLVRLISNTIAEVRLPGDNRHLAQVHVFGPIMLQSDCWVASSALVQNRKLCRQVLAHNEKWATMHGIHLQYQ